MAPLSYQTITLSKGRHDSPQDGACVMELASMLAGEPFSDRPRSVCPVIASFLRAYNDRIDDGRRRDLYVYAAKVVGSRSSKEVERARAERLGAWALELHWSRRLQRLVPARLRALVPTLPADLIGSHAVCAIPQHTDSTHAEVLALIDELLMIGIKKPPSAWGDSAVQTGFRSGAADADTAVAAPFVASTGHAMSRPRSSSLRRMVWA